MGTKIQVTALTSGYAAVDVLNGTLTALADEFDKCIYRDGTAPNGWTADQNADGNKLDNLPDATTAQEPLTYAQFLVGNQLPQVHSTLTGLSANDHPQYLLLADIDDTPVNTETAAPISSNWAYDHAILTTGVHGLAITAGQTLTVTTGGTLGTAAYTAASAYATSTQGTTADTAMQTDGGEFAGGISFAFGTGIFLTPANTDQNHQGVSTEGTAAESVVVGDLVYRVTATGKWAKAKADVATTSANQLAMCLSAASADTTVTLLLYGSLRADSLFDTFTVGAPVYVSAATAGKTVTAAPTGTTDFVVRKVGFAQDANTVFFNPSNDYITLA